MTKQLRLLMLVLLSAVISNAWAGKIVFADQGLENGVQYIDPFDGGDFTVAFSGGQNDGKYYNTGQAIRVYGNGTMTISAKNGNLKKIVLTFAEGDSYHPTSADVVDTGTYDVENFEWTGEASTVMFTRPTGSGHWRVQAVEATVEGGTVVEKKTPEISFSPTSLTVTKGESFTEPTLSYNGDGTISYSIDNTVVASIDASTGKLNITGIGKAIVTATSSETANYKRGTASYSLTVEAGETPDEGESIIFANLGLENAVQYTDPFDGGSFTVTFAGGGNDGKYYNTGQGIRVYGNGTMTVAAKSGNLTKVIVTFAEGDSYRPASADVVDNGSFDPGTGVWTGSSPTVKFTRPEGTGHWRVQKVAAVINGEVAPATLKITGTTPFTGSTTVTITPSNSDYAVYYTTDGSDPATNPKVYTGPFTITETTTVKAVEEDYNGNLSAVVSKTFVKEEGPAVQTVANIAAFKALSDGTEAILTLSDAQVLYVGTNDIYVRDATGAIDFYQTGLPLETGQKLNGKVTGKRATYNKIPELAKTDNTNANGYTATAGTAEAKVMTIAQAKSETNYCDLIKITGVKVVQKKEGTYTNTYAYVGTDSIWIYDRFKIGMGDWNENDTYDVEGILVPYSGKYEIYITQPLASGTETPPSIKVCNNIAEFKALSNGTEAELKLNNAQVLYASSRDVFVRDASGAIDFYNLGIDFKTNQMLNGSIIGKYSPFNNMPELAKTDNTNGDKLTMTDGSAAQPKTVGVAESQDMKYVCDLVEYSSVNVVEDNGSFSITDGTSTLALFNKFNIDLAAANGKKVTGILVIYKDAYQLYPITIGDGGDVPGPNIPICNNIGEFKALESGTEAQLNLNNAVVLYANGNDVYVRDDSGAIEFFKMGFTFMTGQILNGNIIGKFQLYNGLPEIIKSDNTSFDSFTVTPASAPEAWNVTISELFTGKYLCDLVAFGDVSITKEDNNIYASDGSGNKIQLYDKWKVLGDSFSFDNQNQYRVIGILTVFKNNYQVYPLMVDQSEGISEISVTFDSNAPAYNLSGQKVDTNYKGVVIQNGVKFIRR